MGLVNGTLTATEGSVATITSTLLSADTDDVAGSVVYTLVSTPATGALENNGTTLSATSTFTQNDINAGNITYTGTAGNDSFQFSISDSDGDTVAATTFSITVTDPMGLVNNTLAATEGSAATITSTLLSADTDDAASSVVYTLVSVPATGSVKNNGTTLVASSTFTQADINAGNITYTATAGNDSFRFSISDGDGGTVTATTFSITVTDPMGLVNGTLTATEGSAATITSTLLSADTDDAASSVVYTLVSTTTTGALKNNGTTLSANSTLTQADVNAGNITYTGTAGNDSFRFSFSDGDGGTVTATTLSITVTEPMGLVNGTLTATEGSAATITSTLLSADTDDAASSVVFKLVSVPTTGSVQNNGTTLLANSTFTQADVNAGNITYTATAGNDSFQFSISDGDGGTVAATTFSITVTDPMGLVNSTLSATEGSAATITSSLLSADTDDAASSVVFTLVSTPASGAVKNNGTTLLANSTFTQADVNAGNITYTATAGNDSFQFSVSDGDGGTVTATTFHITVTDPMGLVNGTLSGDGGWRCHHHLDAGECRHG